MTTRRQHADIYVSSFGLAAVVSLALGAGPAHAAPLGEPHLTTAPRTAEEAARVTAVTAPTDDFTAPEPFEPRPAGAATLFGDDSESAFSQSSANMSEERDMDFILGNGFFKKFWVTAPSSTRSSDGLGPIYNARACQQCHINDGRGHPPEDAADEGVSMFLRLSIPADASDLSAETLSYLSAAPEPTYGLQLQDKSVAGIPTEGQMHITYTDLPVTLGDGTVVTLRQPDYSVVDLQSGPLHPDVQLSPRVAPQMIGLGLLEAIPEADILANADPDDADGDGISGRPNTVWSAEFGQFMLGRFGLKAGAATVREQSAMAFHADMGLSTSLLPEGWGECTAAQTACRAAPDGNSPEQGDLEAGDLVLDLVTFYGRNLAVPARRDISNPEVLRGKALFYDTGCTSCHTPKFVTHRLPDQPEQSFQLIWPYTDMLLHDMGPGLADNRPEWQATGQEWRTAPLWGIGLTGTVSGHTNLLHDGRARNLLEAILWHGGEAEAARETVRQMPSDDRDALIKYLESL
ncbi:c-type cytochrome [Donghicola sp. C2-DW-16]|uniref:C-type cytochrome n=1 Tax=Donghicola mangrovi TaxID=2729614 RepID=A0ABX2PHF7_9RHOB|nr:di-heme oxidoredictase family protein [Donghicola mangrovi]NVO28356.1 c-type cytochrome [Donghicola mangrovi]